MPDTGTLRIPHSRPDIAWPGGAKVAVMLTFDFDAETLWTSRDAANWTKPGTMSQGTYGARVGVPKILELLKDVDVKGTFFVPGWTAEHHTDRCVAILEHGHEIGHHGFLHEYPDADDPKGLIESIDKGLDSLRKVLGCTPLGYRSPAGETSAALFKALHERGLEYDSSMLDDVFPYRHLLADGTPSLIELPWHWSLDDAVYMIFSIARPRPIFTNAHIMSIWQEEFQEIYRWGGLFDLAMHPQAIGRPSRLALLRQFIEWMQRFPGVWFTTGTEIARHFKAQCPEHVGGEVVHLKK
jgi:peptidoglycan/xylan/chitin deacetylase (PgdA/CDA1 family)